MATALQFQNSAKAPYVFRVNVCVRSGGAGAASVHQTGRARQSTEHVRIDIEELERKEPAASRGAGSPLGTPKGPPRHYHLQLGDQQAYLDFLAEVARDFDLRLPVNRRPSGLPEFTAPYVVLLAEHLHAGILYGYGDPAVLQTRDDQGRVVYYVLSTSNDAPDSFPIIRSTDLRHWDFRGFAFPRGDKPSWALEGAGAADYWAPELHRLGNRFNLYYVARHKEGGDLSIGVAHSNDPEGPFLPAPEPLLRGGKIDPHVFVNDKDEAYLYWKEDNNDTWRNELDSLLHDHEELIPVLFETEVDRRTASLVTCLWPWTRTREPMERFFQQAPVRILENDTQWEAHVIEGMWLVAHEGAYYLFYAGNDFSTPGYGIGVAVGPSPLGPFTKLPGPFLRTSQDWLGPGHPSIAIGPGGRHVLFIHAYRKGHGGYKEFRALLAVAIEFRDGMPVVVEMDTEPVLTSGSVS